MKGSQGNSGVSKSSDGANGDRRDDGGTSRSVAGVVTDGAPLSPTRVARHRRASCPVDAAYDPRRPPTAVPEQLQPIRPLCTSDVQRPLDDTATHRSGSSKSRLSRRFCSSSFRIKNAHWEPTFFRVGSVGDEECLLRTSQ